MFEQFVDAVNEIGGKVADKFGRFKDNAGNVIPSLIRNLRPGELVTISQVFGSTMASSNLRITNGKGGDGRPWCSPSLIPNQFLLHMGQKMYDENLAGTHFLIHEATHAWQGIYGLLPISYLVGSAHCQSVASIESGLSSSNGAYNYADSENLQFFEYNIEQQGQIVAHWFSQANRSTSDWRFRYIRDNIWTGDPNATSDPIEPDSGSQEANSSADLPVRKHPKNRIPRATFHGPTIHTSLQKKVQPKNAPKATKR